MRSTRWIVPAWQKLVADKAQAGRSRSFGLRLDVLLDWLVSKFGSGHKALSPNLRSPEITTFFSDPEAKRLMNRACTNLPRDGARERHGNAEEAWRVKSGGYAGAGRKLSDEELERLVEWLARVWGTNQDK